MWGYPHALSHEGLRAINEFAEAELTAMVINGYANMRRFGMNLMWLFGQKEGDQLKLQSGSPRAHDSSRSVNLRACAGLPQTRDEPSWGEGEASRSACPRVVDSGEDPELHETGISRAVHSQTS